MLEHAMWIGVPKSEIEKWEILEGDMSGRFAYFRLEKNLANAEKLEIEITANARYRLWVNEIPVCSGPCKGDTWRQYCDIIDVSEYLKNGKNVFAVQVLYQDPYTAVKSTDERAAIYGVVNLADRHRLAVGGQICDSEGTVLEDISTGLADWRVYLNGTYYLKSGKATEFLGAVQEEFDCRDMETGWKKLSYDSSFWTKAEAIEPIKDAEFYEIVGMLPRFCIKERPIPMLTEKPCEFTGNQVSSKYEVLAQAQGSTIGTEKGAIVKAGETRRFILDAGKEVNGYPRFSFDNGKQAQITITYFEKFIKKEGNYAESDPEHGIISGIQDRFVLNGDAYTFEPFWVRTFRYICIEVCAEQEDVRLFVPSYHRTHYPLQVTTEIKSTDSWVGEVWEMCLRTLKNCMLETYMDCPYYEQMQFPMDTRLQILFNYAVSPDVRLAKKTMTDYHYGMTPEGLIPGKYPSAYCQIISTFSLHYIYIMEEYVKQTGDLEFLLEYLPDADRILAYYDRKKEASGLIGRLGYWEFVDWHPAWAECAGTPAALKKGPSTIINLMYAYALKCASYLVGKAGRKGLAAEYEARRQEILKVVQKLCWDEGRGMYREGPEFEQYTQHAQAWAVLNGCGTEEQRQDMLRNAARGEDVLEISFATSYEWFRALQMTGLYQMSEENMEQWVQLAKQGHTTCPETPGETRSECHAWSALPIYELIRSIAGFQVPEAGGTIIRIRPYLLSLNDLSGKMQTSQGAVAFNYQKQGTTWTYRISMPEGLSGYFIDEEGHETVLLEGKETIIQG